MPSPLVVDLRSDTVTQPTPAMRQAMAAAEVGDDVFMEDPTVNRLQEQVAGLLGKEAALFVASGTMGNQICLRCHTEPGDEVICEAGAHFLHYENGGLAALSGIQARTIVGHRGVITAAQILEAIRPPAYYMPITKVIALENTHNAAGGTVFPLSEICAIGALAQEHRLKTHLDGARLWNACAATGLAPRDYAAVFDSVSVCFSKGLGAPVGSALAGSKAFIDRARRMRKMFGGGMRQAGILAAAALHALEHHAGRLHEDHARAKTLAENLASLPGIQIDLESVQTNIVLINIARSPLEADTAVAELRRAGVLVVALGKRLLRAVTHLDVAAAGIDRALAAFRQVFSKSS